MLKSLCQLWKRKFLFRIVFYYACIVVLFALINWIMFLYNSTFFSFSEQMNRHVDRYFSPAIDSTMVSIYDGLRDSIPISIQECRAVLRPYYAKLDSINSTLKYYKEKEVSYSLIDDSLQTIIDESRSIAVKDYEDRALHKYRQQIDSLENYINDRDSTEMILRGKYVELANLKLDYAYKTVDVCDYILSHWGSFIPDTIMDKARQLTEDILSLNNDTQKLEIQRSEVSDQINSLRIKFHNHRYDIIGFIDFLYYSFCVSTTVSFGDIAPNNPYTRLVAIIELLSCIVLIGIILDRINMKLRNRN